MDTGALDAATSTVLLSTRAVSVFSLRSGLVTCRLYNKSVIEILVSLRYDKWLEDSHACKLLNFDWLILIGSKNYVVLPDL